MGTLEAIRFSREGGRASLALLEQRALPQATEWVQIDGPEAAFTAIRDMTVRGAPAIGAPPPPLPAGSRWRSRRLPCSRASLQHPHSRPMHASTPHSICASQPLACHAAIAAALSLAVDLANGGGGAQFGGPAEAAAHVARQMDYLVERCGCCCCCRAVVVAARAGDWRCARPATAAACGGISQGKQAPGHGA